MKSIFSVINLILFIIITTIYKSTNNILKIISSSNLIVNNNNMEVLTITSDIYIYSSFYYEISNSIEILGYSRNNSIYKPICIVQYNNNAKINCNISYTIYKKINDNFLVMTIRLNYRSDSFSLYINNKLITPIKITYTGNRYKCTLCITKLINYTAETYILEAINSYKLIGIDNVVLYYLSSSDNVLKILNYFQKIGLVNIITWNYKHETIFLRNHIYGQSWKYNDCLYRYKSKSDLLLFNDIDEVLWSSDNRTIQSIIKDHNLNSYDAIYIYNRIFRKELYSNNNYTNSRFVPYDRYNHNIPDFSMFSYHNSCLCKKGYLSKYIVNNSSKIKYITIHDIIAYTGKLRVKYIDSNIAFLRHTRRVREDLLQDCKQWSNYSSNKEEYISDIVKKMKMIINI